MYMKPIKGVKYENHTPSCMTCKSHDSVCSCNFKAPARKTTPLNSDCLLVNSVVCSKTVQKTGEFAFPFAVGPLGGTTGTGAEGLLIVILNAIFGASMVAGDILDGSVSVRVRPVFTGIKQEITVVQDKIINLGFIPAFLELRILGLLTGTSIPIRIYFQEHTDCPGVCPGDIATETPPVVEAVLDQDLIQLENGNLLINFLLFKAIVRTTITATRQVIVNPNDPDCHRDTNEHRCEPTGTPVTIKFPKG